MKLAKRPKGAAANIRRMHSPDSSPRGAAAPSFALVASCLAAVYFIWGTTYFALKVGVEGAGPYFLIGTRFLVAGALLMAWLRLRGRPLPTLKQWRGATVLAVLMLVIGMGNVTIAEQWVSSGAAVALVSILPLAVAFWSGIFEKWPARAEWMAIGLGVVGTVIMVMGQDLRASPLGTGLILIGVLTWSLGTLLSRRIETPPGAMGFAAEMLAGGVIALLVSAVAGERWELPDSSRVWWAWIYLVIFGSLVAFSAYRVLVERVSPTLASTYAYVNPPVALFVGWWLGAETFSVNVFVGLPIVLAAVALHTWIQYRASRPVTARAAVRAAVPNPGASQARLKSYTVD